MVETFWPLPIFGWPKTISSKFNKLWIASIICCLLDYPPPPLTPQLNTEVVTSVFGFLPSGWRSPLPSSQPPSLLSPFRETIRSSRSVAGSIPRRGRESPRPSPRISPRSPRLSHPKAPSQIPRLAPPNPLFLPIHASKTSQKEPRKERKSAPKRECRLKQSMVIRYNCGFEVMLILFYLIYY